MAGSEAKARTAAIDELRSGTAGEKRLLKCVWSIAWKPSEPGPLSLEGRRSSVIASGGVHRAIFSSRAADRFLAHPSLRIAGESAQGAEAGNLPQPLDQPTPVPAIIESVVDFMRRVVGAEISRCTDCDHELRWGPNQERQNAHYLHGALPLFDTGPDVI